MGTGLSTKAALRLARKTARKVAAAASTSKRVGRAGSRQRSTESMTRRTAPAVRIGGVENGEGKADAGESFQNCG